MGTPDFLRKQAQTPWTENYLMAGVVASISTNSQEILAAAEASFCPAEDAHSQAQMYWRLWADPDGTTQPPWPKPVFRGLDHLIFAGLDTQSSIMIDLKRRRAIGRLSPALAADQSRWKSMIFPNLLTLLGPAIGVTGLHCACVVRDGSGLLLTGKSGAGKSTLTLAMTRRGFSFLSDDWTYFSRFEGALWAWGLIPRLKLLPPAAELFPELAQMITTVSLNGEEAIEIDPYQNMGIQRSRSCQPRELVFLERSSTPEFTLSRMPFSQAAAHLEENLLADTPEGLQPQLEIIHGLVQQGCWQLRYGEDPDTVAKKLAGFFT